MGLHRPVEACRIRHVRHDVCRHCTTLQELEQMQTALLSGASFPACHTPQDYAQALARKFSIASYFGLHIMGVSQGRFGQGKSQ